VIETVSRLSHSPKAKARGLRPFPPTFAELHSREGEDEDEDSIYEEVNRACGW
jgi:hypothetical protein